MTVLKWLLAVALVYGGFVAVMYAAQRSLMYFPNRTRTPPAAAGLPQAEEVVLHTADGENVIVWHVPPEEGRSVILYFHGNGGALNLRADRFRRLVSDGTGLVALSYRGYGGSSGSPSEAGILRDAEAAYAFAVVRYRPERVAVWGESLGTAVAIALAAEHPVGRVILESPFTSAADIGASEPCNACNTSFLVGEATVVGDWAGVTLGRNASSAESTSAALRLGPDRILR